MKVTSAVAFKEWGRTTVDATDNVSTAAMLYDFLMVLTVR